MFDEINFARTIESLRGKNTGVGMSYNERFKIIQTLENEYKEALKHQERLSELGQDIKMNRNLSNNSKKMSKLQLQNQIRDREQALAFGKLQKKLKNSRVHQYEEESLKNLTIRQSTDRIKSLVNKNKKGIDKFDRMIQFSKIIESPGGSDSMLRRIDNIIEE